ncbi:MAG: BatA domain-containing protein [Gemmatimonadota bacterium]
MSFLAPGWLFAAGALALVVVGLHLLTRRRPRAILFPTARFIPDRPASAAAPSLRPSDLLLLAIRVLAVLLLGLALARPRWSPAHRTSRIVLLDQSRLAPSIVESALDSLLRTADRVIGFDSTARPLTREDWQSPGPVPRPPGSLSVAILSALRAVPDLRTRGDSVELMIASAFAVEEWDAASSGLRALWPGRITLVPMKPVVSPPRPSTHPALAPEDPLSATLTLIDSADFSTASLVRGTLSAADSAAARAGATVVHWPQDFAATGWSAQTPDSVYGVEGSGAAVVAQFHRSVVPPSGRPVANWVDGLPAATEARVGNGCIRSVAVPITAQGDFAIRPSLIAFTRSLLAPCGGATNATRLSDAALTRVRGSAALAPSSRLTGKNAQVFPANRWLLTAVLFLLLLELVLRPRTARS